MKYTLSALIALAMLALCLPAYAQEDWCGKARNRREGCPVSINH
jgi:hypothetical protein